MRTVARYALPLRTEFSIAMPFNAVVLAVQTQSNKPYIWMLIETENPAATRKFFLYKTGVQIPTDGVFRHHIGTFQISNWVTSTEYHLFDGGDL